MKLKRNIVELPSLSGRLDRRFALPRALDVFQRISARSGLRRIWGDLPYMRFVQPRAHRPGEAHARPIADVRQYNNSFHTHIAVSPVIREVVREEFQLPVQELDWRANSGVPAANSEAVSDRPAALMPATGPTHPRISHLVRVIEEKRPATVRAMPVPQQDVAAPAASTAQPKREAQGDSTTTVPPAAQAAAPDFSAEEAETLRTLSNTFDLDQLQLNQSGDLFGGDATGDSAASMQPILPREIRERLNLDDVEQREVKRLAARRAKKPGSRTDNAVSQARSEDPPGELVRASRSPESKPTVPRLDYGDESASVSTQDPNAVSRTTTRSSSGRPVIERETQPYERAEVSPARPEISEAEREQRVQATVRETLRSLPETDVEDFASRISRSIERRLRVDQEWRGSL